MTFSYFPPKWFRGDQSCAVRTHVQAMRVHACTTVCAQKHMGSHTHALARVRAHTGKGYGAGTSVTTRRAARRTGGQSTLATLKVKKIFEPL